MINEVEAAIHHSYRFKPTQGRTALSATQFAHKSAVSDLCKTQEIKAHNPSHQLYADIYFSSFCFMILLIKTGIWWQGMSHVRMKLHGSD